MTVRRSSEFVITAEVLMNHAGSNLRPYLPPQRPTQSRMSLKTVRPAAAVDWGEAGITEYSIRSGQMSPCNSALGWRLMVADRPSAEVRRRDRNAHDVDVNVRSISTRIDRPLDYRTEESLRELSLVEYLTTTSSPADA